MGKNLDKEYIEEFIKLVDEYRVMNLTNGGPFGQTDAFWAVGFQNFLIFLKSKIKETSPSGKASFL